MSRGMIRTLILVPLLLIVLVALFLLLRPSSTTQESASTPESTGAQGTRPSTLRSRELVPSAPIRLASIKAIM